MLRTKKIVYGPNFRTIATKKGKLLQCVKKKWPDTGQHAVQWNLYQEDTHSYPRQSLRTKNGFLRKFVTLRDFI